MSVESFIHAMPKIDLHIQLEGAVNRELLLWFAEQSDAASMYKKRREFDKAVDNLKDPSFSQINYIARESLSWVQHPDDIARAVYEIGVSLSKQNIQYAEVVVMPSIFTDAGMSYQRLLSALDDGRDRAERAWGVRMNWIFSMPRENPRKGDETARWATSATGQSSQVMGLALIGDESEQPIAQFKRAFQTAEKKDLVRITHLHTIADEDVFEETMEVVNPMRALNSWKLLENEAALAEIVERELPVVVTPTRELRLGHIRDVANYPFVELMEAGVKLVIASGMPVLYETTLSNEYLAAYKAGLSIDQIQALVLNSVEYSLLPEPERADMYSEFSSQFDELADEHLAEESENE